jgi:hypothetical protein
MSARNGDRARFQKDRKRKLIHRQRIQALVAGTRAASAGLVTAAGAPPAPPLASHRRRTRSARRADPPEIA